MKERVHWMWGVLAVFVFAYAVYISWAFTFDPDAKGLLFRKHVPIREGVVLMLLASFMLVTSAWHLCRDIRKLIDSDDQNHSM